MFKLLVVLTTLVLFSPHAVYSYSSGKSYYKKWDSGKETRRVHFIFNNANTVRGEINLLNFKPMSGEAPKPTERYDREKHFGGWLEQRTDNTCLDTRGKVLRNHSLSKVNINSCRVVSGEWHDPYTNLNYQRARDIQVDHVVALSNAYKTGAHQWAANKRCLYANYLGNDFHLLPVEGEENERKLDYDPSRYIPPNREYTCQYLKTWLKIKNIWDLRLTFKEASAILDYVDQEGCNRADFIIPATEITNQKQYIQKNLNFCKQ